jgi:GNAT superfamily N-acetyltransferase
VILDLDMEVDPNLQHLIRHDPNGFFTAIERDETVGFAAAHIRSRQCILSEIWVLPQHHGKGAGEALIRRVVSYGEQSGAREFLSLVPTEPAIQGLLLRHDFRPLCPVFAFELPTADARQIGTALVRLLPGRDATEELLSRRGHADIDRIDRVTRNITREVDHIHWLKERRFNAAFVQQGSRIAAYAYGGRDQLGPVAGSTKEAALSAMGWAINMAASATDGPTITLRVPSNFDLATEALLDAGARIRATQMLYGRSLSLSFDRSIIGATSLP